MVAPGRKAARVTDHHSCPAVETTLWVFESPHVGGKIDPPGVASVVVNGYPDATIGTDDLRPWA